MEVAETSSSSSNLKPKQSSLCEECKLNPSKYTCPGCSIRSCSLPCVNSHKKRTSCNGKRPRTQFVPISQFDDKLLLSDYNFLEEAKRVADTAKRMRHGLGEKPSFELPPKFHKLRQFARDRNTKLLFLPPGLSKVKKNQTQYNNREKSIIWTIEWRFHSTDVVLIDESVGENTSLCSVIEKHLQPSPWRNKLRPFVEEQLDSLRFFIRKNAMGTKTPFRELDIKAPIKEQLADLIIVEYPVIHVFLPSARFDFEVDNALLKSQRKEPLTDDLPSPKGIHFREEEIGDDISEDPLILDLMRHLYPDPSDNSCSNLTSFFKEVSTENNYNTCGPDSMELRDAADYLGINIEQDLRDAYSGLMEDVNIDDFLNLQECADEGGVMVDDDELEEGEIPQD